MTVAGLNYAGASPDSGNIGVVRLAGAIGSIMSVPSVSVRDGGAFEVYVNGTSAGLLGAAGMPVLGRPIDGIQPLNQAALIAPRS